MEDQKICALVSSNFGPFDLNLPLRQWAIEKYGWNTNVEIQPVTSVKGLGKLLENEERGTNLVILDPEFKKLMHRVENLCKKYGVEFEILPKDWTRLKKDNRENSSSSEPEKQGKLERTDAPIQRSFWNS